ncbi:MAG: hypothetical protein ABSE64_01870 [Vulcanimicrobiaceae bacterium]|jgi:hypothetical protein
MSVIAAVLWFIGSAAAGMLLAFVLRYLGRRRSIVFFWFVGIAVFIWYDAKESFKDDGSWQWGDLLPYGLGIVGSALGSIASDFVSPYIDRRDR